MKTLRIIFTLSALLFSSISFSQTWNHIGIPGSIGESDEMDFVIAPNGDMYIMYRDITSGQANIKTWNGTSWELVGPADISGGLATDYKIEAMSDGTPVIAWKTTSGVDKIRVFSWNGTIWDEYGDQVFATNASYDYDLNVDANDNVAIAFFNFEPTVGTPNQHIWLDVTTSGQLAAGGFSNTIGVIYSPTISIAKSQTPNDHWAMLGETGPFIELNHYASPSFLAAPGGGTMHPTYSMLASEAEVRNVDGTDKFVATWIENNPPTNPLYMRYYDCATNTYGVPLYISANVLASDFAVASDGYAYTMDEHTGYGMTRVDLSDMSTITYASDFITGTTAIDNPRVDTENGILVVAWINELTNEIEVYEEDNPATMTMGTNISICSGVNYLPTASNFTVSDNNYDHSNLSFNVISDNDALISSGSIVVGGSYPNYTLNFPTTALSANDLVTLTVEFNENGVLLDQEDLMVTLKATPNITSSVPASICKNEGPLLLGPLATPSGGVWSGTNVSNNKFFVANIPPGPYGLVYTVTNNQGCTDKDTSFIGALLIPELSITTTLATCGNEDGTAQVAILNGAPFPNYDVYWSTGESDVALIEDLAVGSYFVNVTDANNCTAVGQASINSNEFSVAETLTQIDCHGDLDGAIDLTITGTTGPYTKVWSNGQLTEDLSNLGAGVYDVTITDINGCQAVHSYTIADPGEIFANIDVTSADCGLDNGSLETLPVGGTDPLTFQWFEQGGAYIDNTNLITNLGGGMYYIVITDNNGCTKLKNVTLNEIGGPSITIDSVFNVSCVNTGSIYTTISSTAAIASIDWSNGATTEDITGLTTGFYAIQVEDVNTCIGMASVEVVNAQPAEQLICMVTVDSATNTNRVVWEKPVTTDISHFNIYRETSVIGNYQFVDSVLYADESFFNDTIASPFIRSWRYKIAAVDVCGNEGELSEIHKTIHLTINTGLSGVINLAWDDYEGFSYSTFDIYRHTDMNGWELIESLPSNTFSLTDIAPSSVGLSYMIVIDPPSTCTSTKATDYNSSRSNRSSSGFDPTGVGIGENETSEVNVYPNPTNDKVIVAGQLKEGSIVELIDFNGKIIQTKLPNTNLTEFNLAGFADGIYTIKYITEAGVFIEMVVKL